ncbi:MAG TPA: flagellar hook-length control protein FliK, partial [Accumulibacter sp.]|nr:flagellar hook-length control protein FliK [Accumulibacter sp.]
RVLAEIQSVLPNGSYRALINQRSVTLALPFAAKAGDAIELAVTARDGKLTLAVVAQGGNPATTPSTAIHLSPAGQLIHDLLGETRPGSNAPSALALNDNRPIAEQPPRSGQELSPLLQQAIRQSGMFYESHQAEWVAGRLPQAELAHEPQARLSGRGGGRIASSSGEATMQNPVAQSGGARTADAVGDPSRIQPSVSGEEPPGTQAGAQARIQAEVPHTETVRQGGAPVLPASSAVTQQKSPMSPIDDGEHLSGSENRPATVAAPVAEPETSRASIHSAVSSLPLRAELTVPAAMIAGQYLPVADENEAPLLDVGQGFPAGEAPISPDSPERRASPETAVNRFPPAGHRPLPSTTPADADQLSVSIDKRSEGPISFGGEALRGDPNHASAQAGQGASSLAMPSALQAIVQQQLEAFATQHFSWQGQIWPGQQMHWEIEDRSQERGADGTPGDGSEQWQTRLRLILPNLGEVDARLQIRDQQVTLTLFAEDAETRNTLRDQSADLQNHLAAAGLTLAALGVIQPPI